MTGGLAKIVAAAALVALLGLGLAACGGDDNETTASTSAEAGTQKGKSGSAEETRGSGATDDFEPAPLRISGGGSEQFRVQGGDNSIQEFGEEADELELEEAAEAMYDFYVARAEGRWVEACSHLSAALLEQLEELAAKTRQQKCAPFLEAFTTQLSDDSWREITEVDAGSLRGDGERAFLIYRGAGGQAYAMPLSEEGGEWKLGGLSATTLG